MCLKTDTNVPSEVSERQFTNRIPSSAPTLAVAGHTTALLNKNTPRSCTHRVLCSCRCLPVHSASDLPARTWNHRREPTLAAVWHNNCPAPRSSAQCMQHNGGTSQDIPATLRHSATPPRRTAWTFASQRCITAQTARDDALNPRGCITNCQQNQCLCQCRLGKMRCCWTATERNRRTTHLCSASWSQKGSWAAGCGQPRP
jgi:hypothetical protein